MAIFTQLLSNIRFRPENIESRRIIPKIAEKYVRWLSSIVFLEPEPSSMRSYGHKTDKVLKEHGKNLSGVILERFVKQNPGSQQKKQKAMEWLASLSMDGDSE